MMDGSAVFTGRVVSLGGGAEARSGRVSVRGALVDVALDLVPEAKPGDSVLVHAGIALSVLREDGSSSSSGQEA